MTFFKQFYYFVRGFCSVFYGIYAVFERDFNALGRFDVGRNLIPFRMSFFAYRFNRFGRHFQFARHAFFFCVQNAARNHQLHYIDALGFAFFQYFESLVDTPRRNRDRTRHMPAGDGNPLICGNDTRTCFFAF